MKGRPCYVCGQLLTPAAGPGVLWWVEAPTRGRYSFHLRCWQRWSGLAECQAA